MFRSLGIFNYRLWFIGALVSNIGAWMQRTAQEWLVLTELTDHDAAAVGVTIALQFGPQLLLMPVAGWVADRFDRRTVLIWTQVTMALLGVSLGAIVIFGVVELWHVFAFATALGVAAAVDSPARQAFVSDLVSEKNLPNAVALNSASFHAARLFGPAAAGVLVAIVGPGWVFVLNGLTFAAVLIALWMMRVDQLHPAVRPPRAKGQIRAGLRYVGSRSDIVLILVMIFLMGTFAMNFAVFNSTMATVEFGVGAGEYGLMSSIMAIGALTGALLAARRDRPRLRLVIGASAAFGAAILLAAFMPTYWTYVAALVLIGASSITMMTAANAYVQTSTAPMMRGRVMAVYMAIFTGGTPIGAPLIGWVANEFGPRWALGVGAAGTFLAVIIAVIWMVRYKDLRVRYSRPARRFVIRYRGDQRDRELATQEISIIEGTIKRG
ncbi:MULTISPECIES: MFS transporter [unclassified Cryobacterium]|uniref:MFS transporter n=1 Tax=unclassified Cryobacterium TaxID=2649013 RepID=UPI001D0BE6F1|nr:MULTISPECIES: MFS transporter [unclassified Cryobacterium]